MKKILTTIALLGTIAISYAAPFTSYQVATSTITNGYVLQTDGIFSRWVATSSLGISGGSGWSFSSSTIWGLFSNTATGLTYNNGTGQTSLTGGYIIPITASTSQYDYLVNSPIWRIGSGFIYTATTTDKVAIGTTTTPSAKLRVIGSGALVHIGDSTTNDSATKLLVENRWTGSGTSGFVVRRDSTTNQFVVSGDGNIGIGTSTPENKLTIDGITAPMTDNTRTLGTSLLRWLSTYTNNIFASSSVITNASSSNLSLSGLFYDSTKNSGTLGQILWSTGTSTQWVSTSTLGISGGGITSPLTTKGDLWGFSTVDTRVPVGTAGTVLMASSTSATGLAWSTVGGSGTVTSVDMTVPTGLTVSGNPITGAGTLAISLAGGYNIPLTASTTNWNNLWNASATLPYYLPIASGSLYYLATNPSGYITNSSLSPYMPFSYASTTYMPLASSSLFYLATNPSGYITNTVSTLTNYPTYTYASSTFASTTWVTATFAPKATPTFTGLMTFANASSTGASTLPTLFTTNAYMSGLSSSFLAVDATGKIIATTTPSGGGSSGYATVQNAGTPLTQRSTINFTGSGVTCADNGGTLTTDCTITSGGGAGLSGGAKGLLALWDSASTLVTSLFMDNGTVTGIGATSTASRFNVLGDSSLASVMTLASSTGITMFDFGSNGTLSLNATNTGINLTGITSEPTPPATGTLRFYSKSVAGRMMPKVVGPSGIDTMLQAGLHGNSVFFVAPASGTTAPTAWGGTLTTASTMSVQQTIASANPWQATWRKRFQTTTTAGNNTGMRTAYTKWFRSNAVGYGGFFFRSQFGQNINLNGSQKFVGLCASTGALAATAGAVGALVNSIGMGFDTTDASTGNWQFYHNDGTGTATKVDLGASAVRNTTDGYDLIMFSAPNSTEVFVRITNIHSGVVVLDTSYNTDIPAVNTGLAFKSEANNGAVAAATNIEVSKVYIESDN